ncbi:MAG: cupin domain-containing protein [Deltaproteobacteria bacterium]|nr:cupin domain-containing protein [Deltaproteobacteria bacterium]
MKVFDLKSIQERELVPGGSVRFAHSENMTVSFWTFKPGAVISEHAHPHEQIMNLLEGTLKFTVGDVSGIFEAPVSIIIPSDLRHSGETVTACTIIDVFTPRRDDFAALDDADGI